VLPSLIPGKNEYTGSSIEREIAKANKQFPKQIDAETRINNVAAGPGKLITYNYTLINHQAVDLDADKFQKAMADKIKQETCRNRETQPYIKNGYSIAYSYKGNDGNPVATVTVVPDDCGNL